MTVCPRCGAAIGAEDVSPELRLMRCNACNETFPFVAAPVPVALVAPAPLPPAPWPLRSWEEGPDLVVRYYGIGEALVTGGFWLAWTAATSFFVLVGLILWFWPFLVLSGLFNALGWINLGLSAYRAVANPTLRVGAGGVVVRVLGWTTLSLPFERVDRVIMGPTGALVVAKNGQSFPLLAARGEAATWLVAAVGPRLRP